MGIGAGVGARAVLFASGGQQRQGRWPQPKVSEGDVPRGVGASGHGHACLPMSLMPATSLGGLATARQVPGWL